MLHERNVIAIVKPQLPQVVAEFLAADEELLIAGKAAGERVTPHVNDRRVWKHQVDETDMAEVSKHLIDEVGSAQRSVRLSTRQVTRGARLDPPLIERSNRLRVVQPLGATTIAPQLERDCGDVRQLVRAFDLRVAGQHLLEQGRSRARHADRKSTRLNSSHLVISYAVFCLKKKKKVNACNSLQNRF